MLYFFIFNYFIFQNDAFFEANYMLLYILLLELKNYKNLLRFVEKTQKYQNNAICFFSKLFFLLIDS